jgi:GT2 family glycosyltransferase
MTPPSVAVLIATYRRPVELKRLFESLSRFEHGLALVVVVDNAGCSETRTVVESAPFHVRLVVPGENLGCGGGLCLAGETALQMLGASWTHLLILDDDAVVEPNTLSVLTAALAAADADGASPLVYGPDEKIGWLPGIADRKAAQLAKTLNSAEEFNARLGTKPLPLVWTQGICFLLTRRVIDEVGLHRADFWIRGEDLEFSLRVSARRKVVLVPTTTVRHLPPPEGPLSRASEYLRHCAKLQNMVYIAMRLPHGRRVFVSNFGTLLRFLSLWSWRAIGDALRAYWRGAVLGEPAGQGTGNTFFARINQLQSSHPSNPPAPST